MAALVSNFSAPAFSMPHDPETTARETRENPISCSKVNAHLADALANQGHIARVASLHPHDAPQNLVPGLAIPERCEAIAKLGRLDHISHMQIIVYIYLVCQP